MSFWLRRRRSTSRWVWQGRKFSEPEVPITYLWTKQWEHPPFPDAEASLCSHSLLYTLIVATWDRILSQRWLLLASHSLSAQALQSHLVVSAAWYLTGNWSRMALT